MNCKKRKLRTFGIFARKICRSPELDLDELKEAYRFLQSVGFRETNWQFVFEGQTAGLVLPYNNGENELHIRFYHDRIFTEYEVGRSSIAHFLGPFYNANPYVIALLKGNISDRSFKTVTKLMSLNNLYSEECSMELWNHRELDNAKHQNISAIKRLLTGRIDGIQLLSKCFSWQKVNVYLGIGFTATSLIFSLPFVAVVTIIFAGFFSIYLPKIGQP